MDPFKPLRDIWNRHIRPAIVPEKKLNLFGHRYNKMQEVFATLNDAERNRLSFFIAAATDGEPVKDYVAYIGHLADFCDLCVRNENSALAKGLDLDKISRLKTAADLLQEAVRRSDPAYLARVRAEMPVPDFTEARKRVLRAEIGMLKEDIGNRTPPNP